VEDEISLYKEKSQNLGRGVDDKSFSGCAGKIGLVAAYIISRAENIQVFIIVVSNCKYFFA